MEQKELVGKRVFNRFSIVEVVGYVSSNTHQPYYVRGRQAVYRDDRAHLYAPTYRNKLRGLNERY